MMMIIFTVPEENGRKVLTMAEYIEREALRKVMQMATDDPTCPMHIAATVDQYITEAPAADVELVRHGRWMDNEDYMFCSCCGMQWNYCDNDTEDFHYCPNCGAKMDLEG